MIADTTIHWHHGNIQAYITWALKSGESIETLTRLLIVRHCALSVWTLHDSGCQTDGTFFFWTCEDIWHPSISDIMCVQEISHGRHYCVDSKVADYGSLITMTRGMWIISDVEDSRCKCVF